MLARIRYLEAQLSATQKAYEGLRRYVASRPWDRDAQGIQVREPDLLEEAFGLAHPEPMTSIEPAIEQVQDQGKEKGKGKAQESEALAAALEEQLQLDDTLGGRSGQNLVEDTWQRMAGGRLSTPPTAPTPAKCTPEQGLGRGLSASDRAPPAAPSLPESVAGDHGQLFDILPEIIATQLKSALALAPSPPAPVLAPSPAPSPLAPMALDAGLVLVTEMAVDETILESPLGTAMDPVPLPAPSPPPPASVIEPASAAGEVLVDYPDSDSESMVAEPMQEQNHAAEDIAGEPMDGIEGSSQIA
jgi:hypothetical protein